MSVTFDPQISAEGCFFSTRGFSLHLQSAPGAGKENLFISTKLSKYAIVTHRELKYRLAAFVFSINEFSRFSTDRFLSETLLSTSFSFW